MSYWWGGRFLGTADRSETEEYRRIERMNDLAFEILREQEKPNPSAARITELQVQYDRLKREEG